jgi:cell fate (sporulation/competence/biofilm development) regulator YlbF (YheA/YmcA/DUF963 family)
MSATVETSPLVSRVRELCQFIVSQPEFATVKGKVDAFMGDESAKALFVEMRQIGHDLEHKQHAGQTLDEAEIAKFEKARDTALGNTVVREFMDAQQAMHEMHSTVNTLITKTLELGRVPEDEDFCDKDGDSCGHGCGCNH